jgi:hypothetical protein
MVAQVHRETRKYFSATSHPCLGWGNMRLAKIPLDSLPLPVVSLDASV